MFKCIVLINEILSRIEALLFIGPMPVCLFRIMYLLLVRNVRSIQSHVTRYIIVTKSDFICTSTFADWTSKGHFKVTSYIVSLDLYAATYQKRESNSRSNFNLTALLLC